MAHETQTAKLKTESLRDYAVRLRCPHGDEDVWVMVNQTTETTEQMFQTAQDFECPLHGVQRELPIEVQDKDKFQAKARSPKPSRPLPPRWKAQRSKERSGDRMRVRASVLLYGWVRSRGAFREETQTEVVNSNGALVLLETPVEQGETFFVVNKATQQEQECRVAYVGAREKRGTSVGIAFRQPVTAFWRVQRVKPRFARTIKVWVRGMDSRGQPFAQSAYTVNISQNGARLDSPGYISGPGDVIEVRRGWHKARFRVVWTGQVGTPEANHVGIACLDADKNIWGSSLGESEEPRDRPDVGGRKPLTY